MFKILFTTVSNRCPVGLLVMLAGLSCFFQSCTTSRNVVYLNDLPDTLSANLQKVKTSFSTRIQNSDVLNIRVNGLNPNDMLIVNPAVAQSNQSVTGYLPDSLGLVELPFIGKIKAVGLTISEFESAIHVRMKSYLQDPVVQVRFLNHHVTILGEVAKPGEIRPATERLTILEAIGEAGDLKVTGKRENVLIVREENGKRQTARLNLTSKNLLASPYYYLKNNDVVYVEPIKASYSSRNDVVLRFIGIAASIVSLGVSVLLLVKK